MQDDSDGEIRRQAFRDKIEGINHKSQKAVATNGNIMTSGVEEDTEGESVLIGDEEPVVSTLN